MKLKNKIKNISEKASKRRFLVILLIIVTLSFTVRLWVSTELYQNDSFVTNPPSATDMATYMDLSEKVFRGEYHDYFYYQPFYYAVFIPFIKMFSNTVWAVVLAQCFLSTLTVYISALSAMIIGGRKAGIITAFLAAFSTMLIFYTPYFLIETLQAFCLSMILLLIIEIIRTGKWFYWILAGITLSFSILTRGNVLILLPALFLILVISILSNNKQKIVFRIFLPFVFLACVILAQIPFILRNSRIAGEFRGASTAGAAVLALGNTPEAPPGGRNPNYGPGPMEYPECYKYWMSTEKEISVLKRIIDWMKNEPFAFFELQFRKLLLFWDSSEIPNNIALNTQGRKSKILMLFAFIPSSIILFLGLAWSLTFFVSLLKVGKLKSMFKCRSSLYFASLFSMILFFWLATALFYNLARFRVPVLPLLAVAGGLFLSSALRNYSLNRWKYLFYFTVIPAIFSFFIVFEAYSVYRFGLEAKILKTVRPNGTIVQLDRKIKFIDNGPCSFGGWKNKEFKKGKELIKIFKIPREKFTGNAEFIMPLVFMAPGKAVFSLNGKRIEISSDLAGLKELSEKVKLFSDKISIRLLESDTTIIYFADKQRDYGRTLVDGYKTDSELVCSLYLFLNP